MNAMLGSESPPKISFILPVHNGAAYLAHTIESIREQNTKDWELIVIDDGSTDSTMDLLKYYFKADHRIYIHKFEERSGAAKARNRGNEMARGEVLLVTDCGDIQHPVRAHLTLDYFNTHPDVDIFHSSVALIDEKGGWRDIQVAIPWQAEPGVRPSISHPTMAYRKSVVGTVAYREDSLHTDLYESFLIDAVKGGFKIGNTTNIYVKKRNAMDMPGNRNMREAYKVKKVYYESQGIPVPAHWGV